MDRATGTERNEPWQRRGGFGARRLMRSSCPAPAAGVVSWSIWRWRRLVLHDEYGGGGGGGNRLMMNGGDVSS